MKKLRFPLGAIEVSCPTLERYLLYMYLLTLSQCSQVLWKVALDYRKSNATFSTISTDFFRSIGFFKLKKTKEMVGGVLFNATLKSPATVAIITLLPGEGTNFTLTKKC